MPFSRVDGRENDDIRPLRIVYERLDRVDGSARFGFGETQSLASVSGPIEVRFVAEQPSKATVEVNVRPLSSLPGTESKALVTSLKGLLSPSIILSRNPRTLIQLVIQSLTPSPAEGFSPSLIAACINASTLALLNAGSIPTTSVVCAVAIARLRSATEEDDDASALVLDPSEAELLETASCGCFAFSFATEISGSQQSQDSLAGRMVWTNWHAKDGLFDEGEFARARALGLAGAEIVWKAVKLSVPQMDGSLSLPPPGPLSAEVTKDVVQSDVDIKTSDHEDSDDAKVEI
ncbi:ribosomal protein S5 domain 2-type protein [Russula emetica]|nr:ribosomal protein S5 domain 2-type protein [Russula emetica]